MLNPHFNSISQKNKEGKSAHSCLLVSLQSHSLCLTVTESVGVVGVVEVDLEDHILLLQHYHFFIHCLSLCEDMMK